MRLGASLVSIVKDKFDPELLLPLLEKSAIDDIEVNAPVERRDIDLFAKFSKKSRLRFWSLHGIPGHEPLSSLHEHSRNQAMINARRTIKLAGFLGVRVAVLHASDEPVSERERSYRIAQAKVSLAELVPIAQRSNVILATELLPRTCLGNSTSELEVLLEDLPQDRVGICLDTNHVLKTESSPDIIHKLGPRLVTVHISDFDGIDERHWLPGKGVIDWTAVWHALEEIGYAGPWLYESSAVCNDPSDNIRAIEENFRFWRSLSSSR